MTRRGLELSEHKILLKGIYSEITKKLRENGIKVKVAVSRKNKCKDELQYEDIYGTGGYTLY